MTMTNMIRAVKLLAITATTVAAIGALPATASAEPTLDDLLEQMGIPEDIEESGAERFVQPDGAGGGAAGLLFEYAGFRNKNAFGIYNVEDPSEKFEMIAAKVSPGDFDNKDDLGKKWFGYTGKNGLFSNFGDTFKGVFGFYLENHKGTYYSENTLNSGVDHFQAYQGDGESRVDNSFPSSLFKMTDWVVAFEDLPGGGDQDYNDFVAYVRNVEAVPEPATLLGLGLVAGAGFVARRRQQAEA